MSISAFFDGLKPEPRLTVSEWADSYRYLSSEASAEPGPWRTDRVPFQREIMDDLSATSPVEEIIVMKGAQVASTECGCNWIGYVIDMAPGPMLSVMPTDDTIVRNSRVRINPMIEATPRLKAKVAGKKSRSGDNNTYFKAFPGGQLIMTGANSAAALRSLPIRYLFLDEIDAYPSDLDGEGSPVKLAEKRTSTYSRRKIYKISTPTIKGQSLIEAEFATTDQRYYFVPCPECNEYQVLKFDNLKWDAGRPHTVLYHCTECGSGFGERHKPWMLARGEWRATKPENSNPVRKGYHLSALYSPLGWYSWAKAAADFEKAQTDPNEMKTFVNTVLGESYEAPGDSPPWENIFNRREPRAFNKPMSEVAFITAGVDVQKDRLELEIVGWMPGKTSQSLDYRVLYGSTDQPQVWEDLGKVLNERWEKDDGTALGLRLMGVDSGYNTSHVYEFAAKHGATRVIPLKGSDKLDVPVSNPAPIHYTQKGKRLRSVNVWRVGVGYLKSELYSYLALEKREDGTAPSGYCYFPQHPPDYFKGLTSEKLERTLSPKGYASYVWKKPPGVRNEALDCRVYARACASVLGIERFQDDHWKAVAREQAKAAMMAPVSADDPRPAKKKRPRSDGSFW